MNGHEIYDGLVQDYGISSVLAMEIPQSCHKALSDGLVYECGILSALHQLAGPVTI